MEENKKFSWESYIENLSDFPEGKNTWEKEFIDSVLLNIPKAGISKILEVGCSNGRWLRWFSKEYKADVFGVDNESTGFRKNDIVNFSLGDARNLPYDDNFFDVVFSMGLVEHFEKKDKYQILKEQNRVLKDNGYLVCQVPYLGFCPNFIYMKYAYDWKKKTKHFRTTEKELKNYFDKLGLKIILNKYTGCLLEGSLEQKIKKFKFLNRLFATEMLIIGQK